ncbi:MAG: alpha/beta hydrolase [archaeon]
MKKAILIHSTGGDPDECWYPWLKQELEKRGYEVLIPSFPTPAGQTLENWMNFFEPYWKEVDKETILVGRSIGVPFVLRILEKLDKPVKAAFLVAGFCSDLKLEEFKPYVDSFVEQPFDWDKIRNNCKKFVVYHSNDDPIVKLSFGEEMAKRLQTKLTLIKEGGHFNLGTKFGEKFQNILEDINSL